MLVSGINTSYIGFSISIEFLEINGDLSCRKKYRVLSMRNMLGCKVYMRFHLMTEYLNIFVIIVWEDTTLSSWTLVTQNIFSCKKKTKHYS